MDAPRLLVIAPDSDICRSLTFALEAEGYRVAARHDAAGASAAGRYDCTIIDQAALAGAEAEIRALSAVGPVVLLASAPPGWLPAPAVRVVETPLLGDSLSQAVRAALGRREDNP